MTAKAARIASCPCRRNSFRLSKHNSTEPRSCTNGIRAALRDRRLYRRGSGGDADRGLALTSMTGSAPRTFTPEAIIRCTLPTVAAWLPLMVVTERTCFIS